MKEKSKRSSSIMELVEPFEAAVVKAAQIEEEAIPKRVSLPSIFPPD